MNDPYSSKSDEEEGEQTNTVEIGDEFHSLKEAHDSDDWPKWHKVIEAELGQLQKKGTWELVDKPMNVVPLSNKWVFMQKHDKEGQILKYKACLVARGFSQRPGFNHVKTHSLSLP